MREIVVTAALAFVLSGQQTAQQSAPQNVQQSAKSSSLPDAPSQQAQQKSQIPDAPKPQTVGIGAVAPGKGTTPTFNGQSASGAETPDQAGTPAAKPLPDDTDQTAPVTPANSQEFLKDPNVYTLGPLRVNSVEIPFTVKDNKGKLVPGIDWREVQVYENNVRQHTTVFTVDPYPLSVALVIDQSLPIHAMESVNNSLGALQGAFTPYDEVAVFTYNNGPKMLTAFTGGQSARLTASIERSKSIGREQMYYAPGEALEKGIDINNGADSYINPLASGGPGSPQGVTHSQVPREVHTLNDAILMAAQAVSKAERGRRRVVYVISDGKEYGSKASSKEVIKYLQTNKIEVVATLVGDSSLAGMGFVDSIHLPLMMRDNILPVYTKATGGEFYADYRSKSIETSFAKITEDARTQYTIWYNSREPMIDAKFRNVDVRVLRPNLQVIAKKGYYPSAADQRPVLMTPGRPTAAPASPATSK